MATQTMYLVEENFGFEQPNPLAICPTAEAAEALRAAIREYYIDEPMVTERPVVADEQDRAKVVADIRAELARQGVKRL